MIQMQVHVQRGSYRPKRLIKSLSHREAYLAYILYLNDQIPSGIPVPGNEKIDSRIPGNENMKLLFTRNGRLIENKYKHNI